MTNLIDNLLSLLGTDSPSVSEVGVPSSEVEEGTTFDCELSSIYVDYDWNGRRGNWQADLDDIERSMLPDGDSGPIRQDLPGPSDRTSARGAYRSVFFALLLSFLTFLLKYYLPSSLRPSASLWL